MDLLIGGDGSDTYQVSSVEDTIVETAKDGDLDVVESKVSYALPDNVEVLILTGAATEGKGNGLNNQLNGNAADNALFGYEGDDSLQGSGGDDTLDGGRGNDTLDGGDGADVAVYAGNHTDYKVVHDADSGQWTVEYIGNGHYDEGADILIDIETLRFADGDVPLVGVAAVGGFGAGWIS